MQFVGRAFFMKYYKTPILCRSFQSLADDYVDLIVTYGRDRVLDKGRLLHAHLIISGLARSTRISSKLIVMYVECGGITNARQLFDRIPKTNIHGWIALVGAYARCGYYGEALSIFCEMQKEGIKPNVYVLPSILKACGHVLDHQTGAKIHGMVLKRSFEDDAFVCSALIDMYSKCGQVEKGRQVFDQMAGHNLVALNAMVSGYAHHGLASEAFDLVKNMQILGLEPNVVTWNTLIAAFSQKGEEAMVSEIFYLMVGNEIEPDVVSWTSVISGFVQNFRNEEAFDTFKKMLKSGVYPTSATISGLLPACGTVANVSRGREIHGYALLIGVENDIFVRSALVDMYAKCGFISEARTLFYKMSERSTVTWNSMIFGYANHGYCTEAIQLFYQMMEEETNKLDYLTFTAVLTACSHAGMIELGQHLFNLMQEKYGIVPRLEHYACLVDIFGRAGKLVEAHDIIKKMPVEPDLFVWGALLGACKSHGNIELAEIAAKHLSELEPGSAGSSLLLSGLYADAGGWMNVAKLKKMIKKKKLRKYAGCSWIEAV